MGNWKPEETGPTAEDVFQETVQKTEFYDPKLLMNSKQLEEKAEDDWDFDEDEFMVQYREKRMAEMGEEAKDTTNYFTGCRTLFQVFSSQLLKMCFLLKKIGSCLRKWASCCKFCASC